MGLADSGMMPPMKYWEIIADKLGAAGWSWGYCSAVMQHELLTSVCGAGTGHSALIVRVSRLLDSRLSPNNSLSDFQSNRPRVT
jgi:hypothetical protein